MAEIGFPDNPQGLSLKITQTCRNDLITTRIDKIGENCRKNKTRRTGRV
ncbi:hypothetical protein HMPREF0880_03260 [Yokenella regensburgei ATCC 43003]|nr:hypothetical protein HMPREF0880_03260 [Yokenella regensburgei ATCC 43003]